KRTKLPSPAAEFTQDELRDYPIIVVTHAFYNGVKGNKANLVKRDGLVSHRDLIVIDERPEDVDIYEITYAEAQTVRGAMQKKCAEISEYIARLLLFMAPDTIDPIANRISRPSDVFGQAFVENQLYWFAGKDAETVVKRHSVEVPKLDQLFGFAKALSV